MTEIWQALMAALNSPISSGVYALLVLLVLSAVSLLLQNRSGNGGVPRAVNSGLLGLMGLRLIQIALIALALFRSATMLKLLPALERGVHLMSLVLLVWLWLSASRGGRAGGGFKWGLGLALLAAALMMLFWRVTPDELAFNFTDLDYGWGILCLLLLIGALVTVVRRRGQGRQAGLALFGILLVGQTLHLLLAEPDGDFPILVQATTLLALPLLYRLPIHTSTSEEIEEPVEAEDESMLEEPQAKAAEMDAFFAPREDDTIWSGCEALSRQLAETMRADACALAVMEEGALAVQCGYNRCAGQELLPASIAQADVSRLTSGLQHGRAVRLAGARRHEDIKVLGAALGLENANYLLATMVPDGDSDDELIAILLRAEDPWLVDDQQLLEGSLEAKASTVEEEDEFDWDSLSFDAAPFVDEEAEEDEELDVMDEVPAFFAAPVEEEEPEIIQPEPEPEPMAEPVEPIAINDVGRLKAENEQYRQDVERLLAHIDRLENQTPGDHETLTRQADLIEELQHENEELRSAANSLNGSSGPVSVPSNLQAEQAKEELRLALEQVAVLQGRLDEARKSLADSVEQQAPPNKIPADKAEVIASIAQELRQPLSSILGYTDLLLSESVGILGALQRNFLERVRTSTTRMNTLIDNLIHIAELDSAGFKLEPKPVDLSSVIDDAIGLIRPHLQEKEIILRVDMPSHLPQLSTDRDALQQILFHLLQNADAATPAEGEITLRAFTEEQADLGEFIMLQVADSGGGIPEDELPRVFSRVYRAKNPIIRGVGDTGVGLTIAETLTEALGGRIWVESEVDVGATFSVLLPLGQEETQAT